MLGAVALVFAVAQPAEAAPISIPPASNTAFTVDGQTGAPRVYVWDHFNRANGAIGTAVVGGAWTEHVGNWSIASNHARSNPRANANVTIDAGSTVTDARIDVRMTFGTTAHAGVDFNDDGTNNAMVLYRKTPTVSEVRLHTWLGFGAMPAAVATATVASSSAASLQVLTQGSVVTVLWNGATVITYTMSPTEVGALKDSGSSQYGLWAESDNQTRFNDFRVESP